MKTKKSTRYGIIAIAMVMLIAWCGLPVWAQDHDDEDGDGGIEWGLLLGGGGLIMPKYLGSDEMEFQPVPFIDASLEIGFVELFLNAEKGAGVSLELGESVPVAFSLGVNMGEGREHDDADILKDTPDIENSYVVFGAAELELPSAVGELSATVTYAPTTMNYQESERSDTDYDGLLVSLDWENGVGFSRFMIDFELGLTWMNADYAEANYSLMYPTANLTKTFKAGSGIQDIHASTTLIYGLSERIGIALVGEGMYLLGDAADSPFTKQAFQPFGGAFIVYRF
jgi:outer membrane protein